MLHTLFWEVGVAVGAAIGWLACHVLHWARQRPDAERASLLTVALSLSITTLAAMQVLGGNGILAAFVAGAMLKEALEDEQQKRQGHFNEAFGRFFDLPVMILFGIAAPWAAWGALGWRGAAFAAGVLLLPAPAGLAAPAPLDALDAAAPPSLVRRLVRPRGGRGAVLRLRCASADRHRRDLAGGQPRRRGFRARARRHGHASLGPARPRATGRDGLAPDPGTARGPCMIA